MGKCKGEETMYDYIIIGAGLFGSVFANSMGEKGKKCLVIEKRSHIGGNVYTEPLEGINIHKYGAHIFHTSNKEIWTYINGFAEFNNYINSPLANYKGEIYNLPFNMNTFYKMWGKSKPSEVTEIIEAQRMEIKGEPKNLEEQAISLVGRDVYEKLIKGYTQKQWGRECRELPTFIIKRLPVYLTYNNNYFKDTYQGIPEGGYTAIIEKMLKGSEVILNTDYLKEREYWNTKARKVIYTGSIDAYFNYCYGPLAYRSVRFETEVLDIQDYQGNAVVNYTDYEVPYTRIIEHKHFELGQQPHTVISREYSIEWVVGMEPNYPINDEHNNGIYKKYKCLADKEQRVIFGGRLGEYKYYDMDKVIKASLKCVEYELGKK